MKKEKPGAKDIDPKDQLLAAVEALPASPVKNLLEARAVPYFQQKTPFVVEKSGIAIPVWRVSVEKRRWGENAIKGVFGLRDANVSAKSYKTPSTMQFTFPYLGYLTEQEAAQLPTQNKASDGTVVIPIDFPAGKKVQEGISPKISLLLPHNHLLSEKEKAQLPIAADFTLIKEMANLAFDDLRLEITIKKMQELGLPTHVPLSDEGKKVEAVTQMLGILHDNAGRMLATVDYAGYMLAYKATAHDPKYAEYLQHPDDQAVIRTIDGLTLSNDPETMYYQIMHTVVNEPSFENLIHAGDYYKIG